MGSYPHASHATPFHSSAAYPPCPIKIRGEVKEFDATDHPTRASGSVQYHIDPNCSLVIAFCVVVIPKFATHDHPFHLIAELNDCVSGVTWNNMVPDKSVYVFSHIFANGAVDSRMFTSKCVTKTLLLTRRYDASVVPVGTFVVPPPITPFPLPMNAYTGIVVRPVVTVAVDWDVAVTVVAERAPPTTSDSLFHPIARAPVFIVFTSVVLAPLISANRSAEPLISVHTRPSADIPIHARDPLPTATHRCPGAIVFAVEYAVQVIPSGDHAIILPVEYVPDAGPVATNRFPFHETEFTP